MLEISALGGEECNFQIVKRDSRNQDPYFVELVSCERWVLPEWKWIPGNDAERVLDVGTSQTSSWFIVIGVIKFIDTIVVIGVIDTASTINIRNLNDVGWDVTGLPSESVINSILVITITVVIVIIMV